MPRAGGALQGGMCALAAAVGHRAPLVGDSWTKLPHLGAQSSRISGEALGSTGSLLGTSHWPVPLDTKNRAGVPQVINLFIYPLQPPAHVWDCPLARGNAQPPSQDRLRPSLEPSPHAPGGTGCPLALSPWHFPHRAALPFSFSPWTEGA